MLNIGQIEGYVISKKTLTKQRNDGTYLNMIVGTIENIQDHNQAEVKFDFVAFNEVVDKINNLYEKETVIFEYQLCKMKNKQAKYQYLNAHGVWQYITDKDGKETGPWETKLKITNIIKNQNDKNNQNKDILTTFNEEEIIWD
ncbi:hypothetical protein [Mesoplasma melaleucae]|uniref:Uncharacterized protein n=1 Tax=Mesoplasma melaleucae TaxID=81459 RepID=A0A2K8NW67_9MOLU|nr:hypothetical protein [Mesoplasma melaleucae]ATZ17796.1 hypothetical protein EMELA_v1c02230 [Mesoplasma melaleucae]